MMTTIKDNTILITGAANGLGAALARQCAQTGATLALLDREEDALQKLAAELDALALVVDITDDVAVTRAVADVEKKLGPIAALFNNAGIVVTDDFEKIPSATIRRVIEVDLIGALFVAQAVYRQMLPRRRGTIVNVVSITAFHARPQRTVYGAAKWGLRGFTNILHEEAKNHGIDVLGVYPGGTNTPHLFTHQQPTFDLATALDPTDVAAKIFTTMQKKPMPVELIIERPGA